MTPRPLLVPMHAHKLLALLLVLPLPGCLGAQPEQQQASQREQQVAGATNASPTTPAWNWTTSSFRWADAIDGHAAAHLVASGQGPYACTIRFDHAPTAAVLGWDAAIVIRSEDDHGWYYAGSAWTDVRVHAGPFDTDELLEPYRDNGRYPIEWPVRDVTGELEVFVVALHLDAVGGPNFELELFCDGAEVTSAAIGGAAALFGSAAGSEGAGASANAPIVAPAAAVASGGSLTTTEGETRVFMTGYMDSVAMLEVTGDGSSAGGMYMPAPFDPFSDEVPSFAETWLLGGPGTYEYRLTEASTYGVNAGIIGVTPLR